MSEIKPNHICKNVNCTKGKDGGRKHYYACPTCDKRSSWKAVACSKECFDEYQKQVLDARSKGKSVDVLPERTDMTKKETKELISKSEEEVFEITKEELKDYAEEIEMDGLNSVVETINQELDKNDEIALSSADDKSTDTNKVEKSSNSTKSKRAKQWKK